jgi:hypothetical protein
MKNMLTVMIIMFTSISLAMAQEYVGSSACQMCHSSKYSDWIVSGHPYKANISSEGWNILGPAADGGPQYPEFVQNFRNTWMSEIGSSWSEITGIIGGFGWKARFIDGSGKIIGTLNSEINPGGGHNQMNFFEGEEWGWGDYHPTDDKTYNYGCFKCHTTAPIEEGTWIEGVDGLGTFAEDGVGCEACHGPGSNHVNSPTVANIDRVYEFDINSGNGLILADGTSDHANINTDRVNNLCGTCHNRGFDAPIEAKNGYIKHHEPWEESLTWEGHSFMDCAECHDPHKRVIWGGDGVTDNCVTCHENHSNNNHNGNATCIDCHMPYAGKSAVARGESGYKGDIRSHLFAITVDNNSMFNVEGTFVQDDEERRASLDLGFACLGCHNDDANDDIPNKTIDQALASVLSTNGIHGELSIDNSSQIPTKLTLHQNFPNPFNPLTTISFELSDMSEINITVFDLMGREIAELINETVDAGYHSIDWNASEFSTGVYLVKLTSGETSSVQKMILMK